jgi:hypothetical protein
MSPAKTEHEKSLIKPNIVALGAEAIRYLSF